MTDDLAASQKRAEREIAEGAAEVECGFQVIRQTGRAEITALRRHWTSTFRRLAQSGEFDLPPAVGQTVTVRVFGE